MAHVKKKVKVLPKPSRAYRAGAHLRFQWPRASGRQSLNAQDTWPVCVAEITIDTMVKLKSIADLAMANRLHLVLALYLEYYSRYIRSKFKRWTGLLKHPV